MVARCVRISLFALVVSLTGCLDYSEELVLKPDGSGSLSLDFTIDLSYLEEVSKALGEAPDEDDFAGPTEEEIREYAGWLGMDPDHDKDSPPRPPSLSPSHNII